MIILCHKSTEFYHDFQILLKPIKTAGLTPNVEKSKFCMRSVKYLGHIVGEGITCTDSEKILAMADSPLPKNFRSLRSFLGLVGWYRKFFSNIA